MISEKEFENKFCTSNHQNMNEQKFLAWIHEGIIVMEYERHFHDLSMFAPNHIPIEKYVIDWLLDGFRHDQNQGLVALQFETVKELIEVAQALETCIIENQG
jgi:hypothetical protein